MLFNYALGDKVDELCLLDDIVADCEQLNELLNRILEVILVDVVHFVVLLHQ